MLQEAAFPVFYARTPDFLFCVISCAIDEAPIILPDSSFIGEIVTETFIRLPSFLNLTVS